MNHRAADLAVWGTVLVSLCLHMSHAAFVAQPLSFFCSKSTRFDALARSSFVADGSEYSSRDSSDLDDDDEDTEVGVGYREGADSPTVELGPVPMSKNSGNRFVAFVWDKQLDTQDRDVLDLHYSRISHTEDHVMFCRKANLYNETFNTESMVDVLWSYPMYVIL